MGKALNPTVAEYAWLEQTNAQWNIPDGDTQFKHQMAFSYALHDADNNRVSNGNKTLVFHRSDDMLTVDEMFSVLADTTVQQSITEAIAAHKKNLVDYPADA